MTTGATGQLGLALPVQGELSGTWGDTVNNGITQYTNIAIAGTLTLTGDGAVTLANTTGDASASNITSTLAGAGTVTAQFAIVRVTGTLTVAKVVTGPAYSKTYTVVNAATGGIVTFKAAGQTGVSVAVGESAFVYFNGTDYVKVAGTVAVASFQTSLSGLTPSTATTGAVTLAGTLGVASGGTGLTAGTSGGILGYTATGTLASSVALTANALVLGAGAGATPTPMASLGTTTTVLHGNASGAPTFGAVSLTADVTGVLPTANGGTNLGGATPFTSGGVVYASSTSALATSSALTYNGTSFGVGSSDYGNAGTINLSVGVAGTTTGGVQLWSNTTNAHSIQWGDGTTGSDPYRGAIEYSHTGDGMRFYTSAAEQMRLTSTGLGIGTSSPSAKLAVAGVSNSYGLFVSGGGTSGQSYGASIQAGTTSADMSFRVIDYSGANTYLAVLGNGNVGVGTASPRASSKLDVFGETIALGDNATYYGTIGYSAGAGLMSLAAESGGGIRFLSGATERMRLDSAGNLSLNTTTPAYFAGTSNLLNISINRLPSTGAIFNASQSAAFMNIDGASGGSSFQFCTASAANTQPSERMRLTGAGSLIVGDTATSVTAEKVSIRNNSGPALILRSTGGPSMRFYTAADDASTSCQLNYYSGTAFSIETISAIPITFLTTNIERARITSGGDVYVGTTTGTIGTANFGVVLYGNGTLVGSRNVDSSAACLYYGGNAGYFQILGNGNAQNTNNSYGALSDVKLKENIVDASPKLADLMQVKVRNYNLIGDTTKQLGVVAQELETVFPAMVSETTDKDAEGNDLGTTTKAVKYSVFVPMLIKAMQEQQAIIESLKARLDAANL